jgi:hypothetical protein
VKDETFKSVDEVSRYHPPFSDPQPIPCNNGKLIGVIENGVLQYRTKEEVYKDVEKANKPKPIREKVMAEVLMKDREFMGKFNYHLIEKAASHVLQKIIRDSGICDDWCKTYSISILAWLHVLLDYPSNWDYLNLPKHSTEQPLKEETIVADAKFFELVPHVLGVKIDVTDVSGVMSTIARKEAAIKSMETASTQPQIVKDQIIKEKAELAAFVAYLDGPK